jgi:hypothetical protein
MTALYDGYTAVAVGAVLAVLGWWGSRNAAVAVPATLPEHDRRRRARVIIRGSITCQVVGAVLMAVGVLRALH